MPWAPVAVFAYNRVEHLKKTLRALEENTIAKESDIYLFIDGYKNKTDKTSVENVRVLGDYYKTSNNFRSFVVYKKNTNEGLAVSIIKGVTDILQWYGKVIVLEDDIVTSKDFLQFMNDALEYYENIDKIWSISGFTFDLPSLKNISEDVYLGYRASSWGWATWNNRWETVDWNISDYNKFRYNLSLRNKLNRGGTNMANMLDRQMAGDINSWAIRWCYAQSMQDKFTIFPCKSKVINIGQDGTGTHSNTFDQYTSSSFGENSYKLVFPSMNKIIIREFKMRAGLKLTSRIKRYFYYNVLHRERS